MTPLSRGNRLGLLCLVPFAGFFIVFQIAPLLWVAIHSPESDAGWGWENFIRALSSKLYRQAIQY
ncbi:ABC transporter permease, partial [Pseudomonas syringae pv. tagetis]